jgi:hypothetical protein
LPEHPIEQHLKQQVPGTPVKHMLETENKKQTLLGHVGIPSLGVVAVWESTRYLGISVKAKQIVRQTIKASTGISTATKQFIRHDVGRNVALILLSHHPYCCSHLPFFGLFFWILIIMLNNDNMLNNKI